MERADGKWRSGLIAALGGLLTLAACSPSAPGDSPDGSPAQMAWRRPPAVKATAPAGSVLVVRGAADPRARVLLKADDGAAFAASADGQGRFEIRLTPSAGLMLLSPQVQSGRDVAAAPERLLLAGGAAGVAALVTPGEPVRRLDRRQRLEALESDGRVLIASGTAPAGTVVRVTVGDGAPVEGLSAGDGRWSATLGPAPRDETVVTADGQAVLYPGASQGPGEGAGDGPSGGPSGSGGELGGGAERVGLGWRATWSDPGGAARQVWMPDGR